MQDHLDKLYQYCAKWQLIINNLKTKVLIFNSKGKGNVKFEIGGTPIEIATKYKYLGVSCQQWSANGYVHVKVRNIREDLN